MFKRSPLLLSLALLALISAIPPVLSSQDQAPPPQLYLMGDFLVDASRASEYEAAFKDLLASLAKHGFPILFDTYSTDDSHYYFIFGLENFAGVDRWWAAWRDHARKMGSNAFQALRRRMAAAELEWVYKFWYFRPDLSFLPERERLKPEEIGYYTWDFVWLVPGSEAEFEALNKEWIALSRSREARDPFMTYAGDLGTDGPVYCWFEYGRSAADYAAAEEAFWKSMGDAGADLSKRTRAVIRRLETKTGRYRPDLSYAPRR
jgi:hypothetical protein